MRFTKEDVDAMNARVKAAYLKAAGDALNSLIPASKISPGMKRLIKDVNALPKSATEAMITIHADPVSWSRPRRCGNRTFMDPKYVAAKGAVANHLRLLLRGSVDAVGRYSVTCTFYCETLRRRDLDRLLSLILDAAEGIVYANDSQVDEFGPTRKIIGLPRGAGKTEITIKKIVG